MPRDLFEEMGNQQNQPRDLFAESGIAPSSSGLKGIGEDVLQAFPEMYQGVTGAIKSAPQAFSEVSQMSVGDIAKNALAGMLTGAQGIANLPYKTNRYLTGKGIDIPESVPYVGGIMKKGGQYIPHVPEEDYAKLLNTKPGPGSSLVQGLAQSPLFAVGGEFAEASAIPKMMGRSALMGASQNQNPVRGAVEGAASQAAVSPVAIGNSLRPSKLLSTGLSAEELKKNLAAAQGTSTQLGEIIGNPRLKKYYENELANSAFSGAPEKLRETGEQVKQRGQDVMQMSLGENDPHNVNEQITEKLIKQFNEHRELKNQIYTQANDLADKEGLKLELPGFAKKAAEYSDAIEGTNILKTEPDVRSLFTKLQNYKTPTQDIKSAIVDEKGNPLISSTTYPSLKEATILKGKLNDYSKKFAASPDASQRNMAGVFGNLSKSLKDDIESTISKHGSEELKRHYEAANKNYAKNFSPFLDKDIYKYIGGSKQGDTILTDIVRPSTKIDKASSIKKLMEVLPASDQKLLGYGYLSQALDRDGNLNPTKLNSVIDKLGERQFKALFPNKNMREALDYYQRLHNMNRKALHLMANPETGAQNVPLIKHAKQSAKGAAAGSLIGGGPGAVIGSILAPAAYGVKEKLATKALTSPKLRESLARKMIKQAEKRGRK